MTLDPEQESQDSISRKELRQRASMNGPKVATTPKERIVKGMTPTPPTSVDSTTASASDSSRSERDGSRGKRKLSFGDQPCDEPAAKRTPATKAKTKAAPRAAPAPAKAVPKAATKAAPATSAPKASNPKAATPREAHVPKAAEPKAAPKAVPAAAKSAPPKQLALPAPANPSKAEPDVAAVPAAVPNLAVKRSPSFGLQSLLNRSGTPEGLGSPGVADAAAAAAACSNLEKAMNENAEGGSKKRNRDPAAHARKNRFYRTLNSRAPSVF